MPRFVSLVTAFAADGSERGPTNTLSTPFTGAMYEMCLPSGEMRACALSGLPNNAARGITALPATASPAVGLTCEKASDVRSERTEPATILFIEFSGRAEDGVRGDLRTIIAAGSRSKWGLRSTVGSKGSAERAQLGVAQPGEHGFPAVVDAELAEARLRVVRG